MSAQESFSYQFACAAGMAASASQTKIQDSRPACRYLSLTLGRQSAPVLSLIAEGVRGNISSQIAVKLTLDRVVERAISFLNNREAEPGARSLASQLLQASLKAANHDVHQYGQRLLTSGKIAAMGVFGCYDGEVFSVARVGDYSCFLFRNGKIEEFFQEDSSDRPKKRVFDQFLGAEAKVLVDISSLAVRDGDVAVLTTASPSKRLLEESCSILGAVSTLDEATEVLRDAVYRESLVQRADSSALERNVVVQLFKIGKPVIVLADVVDNGNA